MPVQADTTYEAVVFTASYKQHEKIPERSDLFINYKTIDGTVDNTWWVTENTIDRLRENLQKCFHVTDAQFEDIEFLRNDFLKFITGKPCSIVTEYQKDKDGNLIKNKQGVPYVGVKWMNPSKAGKPATEQSFTRMAGLFGATVSRPRGTNAGAGSSEPPPTDWGISDENTPF